MQLQPVDGRYGCGTAQRPCRHAQRWNACRVFWSREPDAWDAQWEAEEQLRRQQAQQLQREHLRQSAEEAAWRQQVDQVHQQLLDQQKHKAALRSRLQQDAQRAKQEQLRRIAPVAKARARARGLATLGLDPQILSLSEKFGRMSELVDEVQQQVEAQYGLIQQQDSMYLAGGAPAAAGGEGGAQTGALPQKPQVQVAGQLQQQRQQQRLQQLLQQQELPGAAAATQVGSQAAGASSGPTMQPQPQVAFRRSQVSAAIQPRQPAVAANSRQQQPQMPRQQYSGTQQSRTFAFTQQNTHRNPQQEQQQQQLHSSRQVQPQPAGIPSQPVGPQQQQMPSQQPAYPQQYTQEGIVGQPQQLTPLGQQQYQAQLKSQLHMQQPSLPAAQQSFSMQRQQLQQQQWEEAQALQVSNQMQQQGQAGTGLHLESPAAQPTRWQQ